MKIQLIPDNNNRFNISKLSNKNKTNTSNVFKDVKNASPTSPSILDRLNSIRQILSLFFDAFHKHLHVRLTKIHIKVATADAAQTAILYGAVSTAVACIVDIIDEITNLKRIKASSISVEPDFLSEKSNVEMSILLYISVLGAIKVLMKSFIKYYSMKNKTQINNRKEN